MISMINRTFIRNKKDLLKTFTTSSFPFIKLFEKRLLINTSTASYSFQRKSFIRKKKPLPIKPLNSSKENLSSENLNESEKIKPDNDNTIKIDLKKEQTNNNQDSTKVNQEEIKKQQEEEKLIKTKPILERMEYYYRTKQYDKVIALYMSLSPSEKMDNSLYRYQAKQAKKQMKAEYEIILHTLYPEILRSWQFLLVFAFIIVFGYTVIFPPKPSIPNSNQQQQKPAQERKSIFKLFDMDQSFEISFAKDIKERLDDVKGIDEVKEEIEQLIWMIKSPSKYIDAGAKLHKGILLSGKPGTGKTLIARAIAGEAQVNFIFLTGSDFDEMFVGVGASRIRKLFKKAKETAPCIIFIDEIDSLLAGSRRVSEHSSSRATLNQFLAEMDGFNKLDQIYVLGATNHEKDLDAAAVRPGRFDKTIHINVPDEEGRIDIIKHYLEKIKLPKKNIDPKYISKLTPGFTGAEIENLVNLSILHALNLDKEQVDMEDFYEARDRVLMGIPRKNYSTPEKTRFHTSLHEAGHTLICYKSPNCRKTLHKVTIIPRGGAAGVTLMLSDEDSLNSKNEFLSQIDTAMGGHVAEELLYGSDHVTAGCSSDLNKATQIAQMMVKKFGMYGQNVGYIYVEDEGYSWEEDEVSDKYKTKIDEAVQVILKDSHDRVYQSLKESANELKNISQKLYQYDTLNYDELEAAIEGRFSDIKRDLVREEFTEEEEFKNTTTNNVQA
jgi:ATP-dependent metalloprotease